MIREEMVVNDFTTDVSEAMIDPVTGEIIDQKDLASDCSRRPRSRA